MTGIIKVTSIAKSYGSREVLKDVNFSVNKGEIFALLGSNGAGKTTLVNILTTLLRPSSGNAEIAGYDVVRQSYLVRRNISLTGQYAAVDDLLTGRENIVMIGQLSQLSNHTVTVRAKALLERFNLEESADKLISTYSGGMRRKLDLAISLLSQPPIIFLDEPTTGLDPRSRQELWQIVKELAGQGTTIFLTTQYLEEADYLANRIAILEGGRIVAEGTAAELKDQVGAKDLDDVFMKLTGGN